MVGRIQRLKMEENEALAHFAPFIGLPIRLFDKIVYGQPDQDVDEQPIAA